MPNPPEELDRGGKRGTGICDVLESDGPVSPSNHLHSETDDFGPGIEMAVPGAGEAELIQREVERTAQIADLQVAHLKCVARLSLCFAPDHFATPAPHLGPIPQDRGTNRLIY